MARDRVISATHARIHFGELMRQVVDNRETVVVERGGEPQIVLVSLAEYKRLLGARSKEGAWSNLVQRARQQIKSELGGRQLTPSEDVLGELRAERDAGPMGVR
jgi:prevent-host-death family protein